jgi:hypothetical protein
MNAYLSNRNDLTYLDEHPVLLAAGSDAAIARAEKTIKDANLRVGAKLAIEEARERIEIQPRASAVWIELDRDCGAPMIDLLHCVGRDASEGRYGAVVSVVAASKEDLGALIDPVSASIDDSAVEFIANADEVDRVAALATVTAQRACVSSWLTPRTIATQSGCVSSVKK